MELSKRQLQKSQTRSKIIQTAFAVYSEHGFQATTSMIAKAAGVSHGTIFVHFATLDELLICLVEEFGVSITTKLHELCVNSSGVKEMLQAHLQALKDYESFYTRLVTQGDQLPGSAKLSFVSVQSTVAFHFGKGLAMDIANGLVKDVPVHILFNTWVGLIHYYIQNREFFSPAGSVLKRYEEELMVAFMKLITN